MKPIGFIAMWGLALWGESEWAFGVFPPSTTGGLPFGTPDFSGGMTPQLTGGFNG